MKKKILLLAFIGAFLTFVIYSYLKTDTITFTALGDGFAQGMTPYSIKGYSYNDYLKEDLSYRLDTFYDLTEFGATVKELNYEITDNKEFMIKNENIAIQRAIHDADIITLAIGMDELSEDKITSNMIKDYENDMNELLTKIKKLTSKKVIILGLYTIKKEEELNIMKLNAYLKDKAQEYHYQFIDINYLLKNNDYYLDKNNYYVNFKGHQAIYEEIKKIL